MPKKTQMKMFKVTGQVDFELFFKARNQPDAETIADKLSGNHLVAMSTVVQPFPELRLVATDLWNFEISNVAEADEGDE